LQQNEESWSRPGAREDKMPVSPIPCCRGREGAPGALRRGSHLCTEHNRPLRRLGGRDNPVPALHVNVLVGGLGNGRHLQQCRKSCLRRDRDSSSLPCSAARLLRIGIGGASRLLPTHITVYTGAYP
jgi:hypothetical protein